MDISGSWIISQRMTPDMPPHPTPPPTPIGAGGQKGTGGNKGGGQKGAGDQHVGANGGEPIDVASLI